MRGATTPLQYWDEFAFLKHNDVIYKSSAPAASQAMISANDNNKPYGKVITTTPNNIDIKEGLYCKQMIDRSARFDEKIYDWTEEEISKYLRLKSENDFIHIQFTYTQLGRDEEWFVDQCRQLEQDRLAINREIRLEWTRSSEDSVYDEESLTEIDEILQNPIKHLRIRKYHKINIYEEIDPNKQYVIGVDPSTGSDQDSTAIVIVDPYTFKPVANFKDNRIHSVELRKLIVELVLGYFPKSLVVVENNSLGKIILDFLMDTPIYKNLYYEEKYKYAEEVEQGKKEQVFINKSRRRTKTFGINTNKTSRQLMFEILDVTVMENPEQLAIPDLYSEVRSLTRDRQGKPVAREGSQDDTLMAYLIARYTIVHGTNVSRFLRNIRINVEKSDLYNTPDSKRPLDIELSREDSRSRMLSNISNANVNDNFDKKYNYIDDKEYENNKKDDNIFNRLLNDLEEDSKYYNNNFYTNMENPFLK